jgi:hypothetical protein
MRTTRNQPTGLSAPNLLLVIYTGLNLLLMGLQGGFTLPRGQLTPPASPPRYENGRILFADRNLQQYGKPNKPPCAANVGSVSDRRSGLPNQPVLRSYRPPRSLLSLPSRTWQSLTEARIEGLADLAVRAPMQKEQRTGGLSSPRSDGG